MFQVCIKVSCVACCSNNNDGGGGPIQHRWRLALVALNESISCLAESSTKRRMIDFGTLRALILSLVKTLVSPDLALINAQEGEECNELLTSIATPCLGAGDTLYIGALALVASALSLSDGELLQQARLVAAGVAACHLENFAQKSSFESAYDFEELLLNAIFS